MVKNLFSWKMIVGAVTLAATLAVPASSQADPISLSVVSLSSNLTLSGQAFTLPYAPQVAGSLTAAWSGTISGDLTGGIFTFSGGSSITGLVNPTGPFTILPNPSTNNGNPGSMDASYGVTATGIVPTIGLSTVNGVYRSLILNITTGTAQNGLAPSGLTMQFTTGTLDYGAATPLGNIPGTSNLAGVNGLNTSAGLVSWDGTTLTLPVTFHTVGSNRDEFWTGTLVAVAVPEPTTVAFLSVLGLGAGYYGYSRRRAAKRQLEQRL